MQYQPLGCLSGAVQTHNIYTKCFCQLRAAWTGTGCWPTEGRVHLLGLLKWNSKLGFWKNKLGTFSTKSSFEFLKCKVCYICFFLCMLIIFCSLFMWQYNSVISNQKYVYCQVKLRNLLQCKGQQNKRETILKIYTRVYIYRYINMHSSVH